MSEEESSEMVVNAKPDKNRELLMAAAAEVFAEVGFAATLDEVAARAGLGVGTAYRRFANKQELIDALFRERIDELEGIMGEALAEDDPWNGITTYLELSVALGAGDKGFREMMLDSPAERDFVGDARARLMPLIEDLVARAHQAGVLREGIEATDLVMVVLMLSSKIADYHGEVETPFWRRYFELMVEGLRVGAGGPLPGRAPTVDEQNSMLLSTSRAEILGDG